MATNFIELLKETFDNIEDLNEDKIGKLSSESATFFNALQVNMNSKDGKAKEDAYRSALEIKEYLETRMKRLSQETGLNFDQLVNLARDPEYKKDVFAGLQKFENEVPKKETPRRKSNNNKTRLS